MPIDMQALARLGAQTQIAALVAEIDALLKAFPDLGQEPARPASAETTARKRGRAKASVQSDAAPAKRGRKGWSAAAKKAVGERMKAYWSKRKAGAATPEPVPATVEPEAEAPAGKAAKPAGKRTMSAEAKARISAAQKKRWRKQRAKKR